MFKTFQDLFNLKAYLNQYFVLVISCKLLKYLLNVSEFLYVPSFQLLRSVDYSLVICYSSRTRQLLFAQKCMA